MPDTVADVFFDYYLRFPGFRYHPVVGVTQQQAVAYCQWRSAKVMETFRNSPDFRRQRRRLRDYEVQIIYCLPTAEEWKLAASGRLDPSTSPFGYEHPPRQVSKYKRVKQTPICFNSLSFPAEAKFYLTDANVLDKYYYQKDTNKPPIYFRCEGWPRSPDSSIRFEDINPNGSLRIGATGKYEATEYVYAYPSNGYGLYNMIGNVAEITSEPGQAKGGSFEHSMQASNPQTFQAYDGPQEWLGFRCACTIRVKRKPGSAMKQ